MTDVVEWLRNQQTLFDLTKSKDRMPEKAAAEIERLRAALDRALKIIDCPHYRDICGSRPADHPAVDDIRAVLKRSEE